MFINFFKKQWKWFWAVPFHLWLSDTLLVRAFYPDFRAGPEVTYLMVHIGILFPAIIFYEFLRPRVNFKGNFQGFLILACFFILPNMAGMATNFKLFDGKSFFEINAVKQNRKNLRLTAIEVFRILDKECGEGDVPTKTQLHGMYLRKTRSTHKVKIIRITVPKTKRRIKECGGIVEVSTISEKTRGFFRKKPGTKKVVSLRKKKKRK